MFLTFNNAIGGSISELVQDGVNGFAVSSAEELANRMQVWIVSLNYIPLLNSRLSECWTNPIC